ncbi:HAD-superfamily hydrolase [Coniochaeta ligniaria NRRL 30616]|uniref:HAD-superfamily hydrolase n=1 Tax=Coniochaeta ligniaria NRRL 30616 TaxID=1408157 RepID=A0A1J7IUY1_9PEZI|nr:HAD-superfamily hydrolase [Coniochaeta ligniaria NRRL 30616]
MAKTESLWASKLISSCSWSSSLSESIATSPSSSSAATSAISSSSIISGSESTGKKERDLPPTEAPSFAFAFDIDGVLLHVSKPIPGATETLRFLQEHNIPFILLTNGGGRHESERVADLSQKLGVPLTTSNFVQSHTPFQELVDDLADKTILVTGADADKCRAIAQAYGFKNVVTPADVMAVEPRVWPFETLMEEHYARTSKSLPSPVYEGPDAVVDTKTLGGKLKIDAMFVFNDPRDWALDIQIMVDLLLSQQGYLGTYSPKNGDLSLPNCGWQGDGQPALYFSNADLFWSTGYHLPRFGQGAFQAAIAGIWRRVTGGHELHRRVFGKPSTETYAFAERVLQRHRHELLKELGARHGPGRLGRVYMVGDNPESDIAGANGYQSEVGTEWASVLVKTGVWTPDRAGGEAVLKGQLKPSVITGDVREGVRWALEREGYKGVL